MWGRHRLIRATNMSVSFDFHKIFINEMRIFRPLGSLARMTLGYTSTNPQSPYFMLVALWVHSHFGRFLEKYKTPWHQSTISRRLLLTRAPSFIIWAIPGAFGTDIAILINRVYCTFWEIDKKFEVSRRNVVVVGDFGETSTTKTRSL